MAFPWALGQQSARWRFLGGGSLAGLRTFVPMLLVLLAVTRGANAQTVSEVRIGGLFRLVLTSSVNDMGSLAAFVMAVQEINNSPDLLPNVTLR